MGQVALPDWEQELVDEVIAAAERRRAEEKARAARRAVQLAREQAYHRLALAIDRPAPDAPGRAQLSLFPRQPTLFEDGDDPELD